MTAITISARLRPAPVRVMWADGGGGEVVAVGVMGSLESCWRLAELEARKNLIPAAYGRQPVLKTLPMQ
jgi:hypothetical protein